VDFSGTSRQEGNAEERDGNVEADLDRNGEKAQDRVMWWDLSVDCVPRRIKRQRGSFKLCF